MRPLLSFSALVIVLAGAAGSAKEELWEGKLKFAAGIELRLVLRTTQAEGGARTVVLDSPDQGLKDLKVDTISFDNDRLTFTMKALAAGFSGKLNAARTEAVGEWKQGGVAQPLTLKKIDKLSELPRPQTPKPPFPYTDTPVTYRNTSGGITLAGTLTVPNGKGPFPAAILISGSGAHDRDESVVGHKPFLVLADHLARRGIAVLRVDDRGVGGSSGNTMMSTSEDFAGDVRAGMDFLKSRPEIDPRKIGLIGHSEGGLIAPIVASRSKDVAFIVSMGGTGLPGEQIVQMQAGLIAKATGINDAATARALEIQRRLLEVVKAEKDDKAATKKMSRIAKESLDAMPESERKQLGDLAGAVDAQIALLRTPWFRFFVTFDPRPTLAKVRCPFLAMVGEKDLQVPPKENLAAIAKALKDGGNTKVTVKELPGLNHLFQTCTTGAPSEYKNIEETISPSALNLIADWIGQQVDR